MQIATHGKCQKLKVMHIINGKPKIAAKIHNYKLISEAM